MTNIIHDQRLHDAVAEFISRSEEHISDWLQGDYAKLYFRKWAMANPLNAHFMDDFTPRRLPCLVISNISVQEIYWRKGIFKSLLNFLQTYDKPIMVESVVNHGLLDHLLKNGFRRSRHDLSGQTVFWLPPE